jgi:hypothetical protein
MSIYSNQRYTSPASVSYQTTYKPVHPANIYPQERYVHIPNDYGAIPPAGVRTIYNVPTQATQKTHVYCTHDNYGPPPAIYGQSIKTSSRSGSGVIPTNW